MRLTARSKSGIYKQLVQFYIDSHNFGDEIRAERLHKLSQDVLYDDYLTIQQIKAKFIKAMNLQ